MRKVVLAAIAVVALGGCSGAAAPTPMIVYVTPAPVATPTPIIVYVTPAPTLAPTPSPTTTPEPTPTPAPTPRADTFGDGTWGVGSDIKAGTYRTLSPGCYWARLRSLDGSFSAVLANDNTSGPTVVTILKSDKGFESSRCLEWTSNLARASQSTTVIEDGTWITGVDFKPGTYQNEGAGCYWARLSNFTGALSGIVANDNTSGPTRVTISSKDKGFTSSRCGTWTRVGP